MLRAYGFALGLGLGALGLRVLGGLGLKVKGSRVKGSKGLEGVGFVDS